MDHDEAATEYDGDVEPVLRTMKVPSEGPAGDQPAYGGRRAKHGGGGKEGAYAIALIVALIIVIIVVLAVRRVRRGGSLWPWASKDGFSACGGCGGLGAGWGF